MSIMMWINEIILKRYGCICKMCLKYYYSNLKYDNE